MSTTLKVSLPSVSGEAGPFTLFLRKTSDQSLVNSGGDALTEIEVATVKSGVWNVVVSETLPAEDLHARIYEGTSENAASIILDGRLIYGRTEIGADASQDTILAKLGAWTGAGTNTVLGALRAIAAKASGLTPTDLSTGTTFDNTVDSIEAIRDRGDAAWTTGSGGGGGGGTMSEAVVVAKVEVGATVGWPDQFTIGDAYLSATNTAPKLFIKDLDDNILDGLGDKMFSDADFVGVLRFVPVNDTTREQGTPAATIEVSTEDAVGIVYNDDTADSEFFALQIPRAKSSLAQVRTRYLAQFIMNWDAARTYERTVHLGEVQFVRKANPVA